MALNVGSIFLNLKTNDSQFKQQMGGMNKLAAKLGATLAGAFAVSKLVQFGKACIDLGSDLAEVQNVVDVTFPSMQNTVNTFAQNAAKKFGLSETMAKRYAGTLGSMAEAFGFTEKQAADMSMTLTGLAGDVASFYNISQDEAYTKLKSVFTGETESLKDLGVVMTQTALDQYALANGFGKTTAAMGEAEKVSLRYAFVQSQLANATGDFSRTSDSWANQVRILSLQFDSLRASIGQGLINVFKPVLTWLNTLVGKLITAARAFANFTGMFSKTGKTDTGWTSSVANDMNKAGASAVSLGTSAGKASKGIGSAAKQAKKLKRELAGFDQITKLSEPETNSSSGSSGSSGGTGGAGGTTGGVDSGVLTSSVKEMDAASGSGIKLNANFDNLKKAFERLKESFSGFAKVVKGAFSWVWENILKPLGKWTIEKLAPKLLDVLSAAFEVLTEALKALQPAWQWLWDHFFSKIAKFAGDAIIKFLELLAKGLEKLAGWISKHPKLFNAIVTGLLSFMALRKAGDVIGGITKKLSPFTNGLKNLVGGFKNASSGIKMFSQGSISLKTLASGVFPKITGSLSKVKNIFSSVGKGIKTFGGSVGKIGGTIGKAFLKVGKAIGSLLMANPILLLIVGAIGAAIAIGILLYKNWDKIKAKLKPLIDAFKKFGKTIQKIFKGIPGFFKKIFKKVKEFITAPFKKIGSWFKDRYEDICNVFGGIKDWFAEKFGGALSALKDHIPDLSELREKVTEKIGEIKAKISGALEKVKDWWSGVKEGVKEKIGSIAANVAGKIEERQELWNKVKEAAKEKVGEIAAKVAGALNTVKDWWSNVKEGIKNKIGDVAAKVSGALNTAKDWWSGVKEKAKEKIGDIAAKVAGKIEERQEYWNDIKEKLGEKIGEIKAKISAWFSDKKEEISARWSYLTENVKEKVADLKARIASTWSQLKSTWSGIVNNIQSKTADMKAEIASRWSQLKSAWTSITNNIKSKTADMKARIASKWSQLKGAWSGITNNIKGKTVSMKAKIASKWSDFRSKWSSLLGNFKGKTVSIGMNIAAKVSDLKKWFNDKVISKVNNAIHKIPILKNFSIPKLAQGGYVKKNTPQLAMIGDNRHQGEVVAPEDKLLSMARQAAGMSNSGHDAEIVSLLRQILAALKALDLVATVDGRSLKNMIVKLINEHTRATGICEINI